MKDVINKLLSCSSAAVLAHISEDPDAVASSMAMAHMLRKNGKEAVCYFSDTPEKSIEFIGSDYVVYKEGDSIGDHDLCICLDCGDYKRLGARKVIFEKIGNSVNIDHHYTNPCFGDANLVEGDAAATAQLLFDIFHAMDWKIDSEAARLLYIGIAGDTGCFKYGCASPHTMRMAAELMEHDIRHEELCRLLFDTYSLNVMKMKAEVMANIKTYANGKVNIITLSNELYDKYGLSEKDAASFVDIPRCIEGTEIAVCIKAKEDKIRVSFRSNGEVNVAQIAEKFGGGGHVKAAGGSVSGKTLAEAEKLIAKECERAIEELWTE